MDGVINVYKEKGYTSFDVVAKLRGILKTKKIGHTGTLDPMAEGVLPVCLGSGTKLVDDITGTDKVYRAEMVLGVTYDTQDTTGELLSSSDKIVTEEDLKEVLKSFTGDIEQIPPMYSAVKINGVKLYSLARRGIEVERKPRQIRIENIEVNSFDYPKAVITVTCSKGTYIRTLIDDIGSALGCGAAMSELTRLKTGDFEISGAYKIDDIEKFYKDGRLGEIITYVDDVFTMYPELHVKVEEKLYADNGNRLLISSFTEEEKLSENPGNIFRVYDESGQNGLFYGLYAYDAARGDYKPFRMFFSRRSTK